MRKRIGRLSLVFGLLLLLLAPAAVAQAQSQPPKLGQATITNDGGTNNKITITATNIAQPQPGTQYTAELLNADGTKTLQLGALPVDQNGNINKSFTTQQDLIANYNVLWVFYGPPNVRAMEAGIPSSGMAQIRYLLVGGGSQDPQNVGYINGMVSQAALAAQHAGFAIQQADSGSLSGVKLHAEHVINIINGTSIDYNGDGQGQNPGDGVGLINYAKNASSAADAAMSAVPNFAPVQDNAPNIKTAASNVTSWANQAVTYAKQALNQKVTSSCDMTCTLSFAKLYMQEAQGALESAQEGNDSNNNGTIEPIANEAGAQQALQYGQQMVTYQIQAAQVGKLPSVGDTTVPMLPLGGLAAGLGFVALGSVLLLRRRTVHSS